MIIKQILNIFCGTDWKQGKRVMPNSIARCLIGMTTFNIMEYFAIESVSGEQHVVLVEARIQNTEKCKFWINKHDPEKFFNALIDWLVLKILFSYPLNIDTEVAKA